VYYDAKIVNKNKSTNTFSRNTTYFSRFVLSEGSFDTFTLKNMFVWKKALCLEQNNNIVIAVIVKWPNKLSF
jgi:hypothetical protein